MMNITQATCALESLTIKDHPEALSQPYKRREVKVFLTGNTWSGWSCYTSIDEKAQAIHDHRWLCVHTIQTQHSMVQYSVISSSKPETFIFMYCRMISTKLWVFGVWHSMKDLCTVYYYQSLGSFFEGLHKRNRHLIVLGDKWDKVSGLSLNHCATNKSLIYTFTLYLTTKKWLLTSAHYGNQFNMSLTMMVSPYHFQSSWYLPKGLMAHQPHEVHFSHNGICPKSTQLFK